MGKYRGVYHMYQSKKAGRNNLRFFDPHMQKAINTRASLENELHRALENGQLVVLPTASG